MKKLEENLPEKEAWQLGYNEGYNRGYADAKKEYQLGPWEKRVPVVDRMGGAYESWEYPVWR